jgi:hypothetical protein
LADDQGRNWIAWHPHQTLALLAACFLTQETRRGKNTDPCALTSPQLQELIAGVVEYHFGINHPSFLCRRSTRWLRRNEQSRMYSHILVKN